MTDQNNAAQLTAAEREDVFERHFSHDHPSGQSIVALMADLEATLLSKLRTEGVQAGDEVEWSGYRPLLRDAIAAKDAMHEAGIQYATFGVMFPEMMRRYAAALASAPVADNTSVIWKHTDRATRDVMLSLTDIADLPFNRERWESVPHYAALASAPIVKCSEERPCLPCYLDQGACKASVVDKAALTDGDIIALWYATNGPAEWETTGVDFARALLSRASAPVAHDVAEVHSLTGETGYTGVAPAAPVAEQQQWRIRVVGPAGYERFESFNGSSLDDACLAAQVQGFVCCQDEDGHVIVEVQQSAPVAGEAQPVATLHDDGYYTWHGAKPEGYDRAGWRMKVYAAPQASEAYTYARNLAVTMWEKRFKLDAPEWKPCEDLIGVLTQIDNMVAGLVVPQASEAVREALWTLTEHNALHFGEQHNTVIQGRAALAAQPGAQLSGNSGEPGAQRKGDSDAE